MACEGEGELLLYCIAHFSTVSLLFLNLYDNIVFP